MIDDGRPGAEGPIGFWGYVYFALCIAYGVGLWYLYSLTPHY